jgi:Xaa-Pro aminopeptidase
MSKIPSLFSPSFFSGNRKKLAEISKAKIIVVVAHAEIQSSGDMAYKFRQDSSFRYLTGLGYPELLLVIDVEKNEEWVIGPKTEDPIYDVFNGAFDRDAARATSGIENFLHWKEGWPKLVARAAQTKQIHTLLAPPKYISFYKFYSNPARAQFAQRLKRAVKGVAFEDLRPVLASMRQIKQAPEVAALQKAIDITGEAFAAAWDIRNTVEHEFNMQARMEFELRNRGANGVAYGSIIASGGHACTLHYEANNASLKSNELLLMDVGADYEYYAADITRTVSVGKRTDRQKAVYDAVLHVQQTMMKKFVPGANRREIEDETESMIGQELKKLKLITTMNRSAIRHYYPHAIGHFLGLDPHDLGDYTEPLQPGMVMTVEPGIYIPEENIGVRIEDDILITTDGYENLSKNIPMYAE